MKPPRSVWPNGRAVSFRTDDYVNQLTVAEVARFGEQQLEDNYRAALVGEHIQQIESVAGEFPMIAFLRHQAASGVLLILGIIDLQ